MFFSLSSTADSSKEFVPNRRATLVMRGYISEKRCLCEEFYHRACFFPVRTTIATTSNYLLTVVIYSLSPFCLSVGLFLLLLRLLLFLARYVLFCNGYSSTFAIFNLRVFFSIINRSYLMQVASFAFFVSSRLLTRAIL